MTSSSSNSNLSIFTTDFLGAVADELEIHGLHGLAARLRENAYAIEHDDDVDAFHEWLDNDIYVDGPNARWTLYDAVQLTEIYQHDPSSAPSLKADFLAGQPARCA